MNYEKYSLKKISMIFISVKVLLQHAALYIARRPQLKRATQKVLHYFPGAKAWLAQAIRPETIPLNQFQLDRPHNMLAHAAQLTPHARQVYADLKAAIESRQKVSG
jgi:O-antigen chain-terminating methyltransferase